MQCPACKGSGELPINPRIRPDMEAKRIAAKALQSAGYSVRQIMRILNYKSPRSVAVLLKGE